MFDNFIKNPFCIELGDSIRDYCEYLCRLEKLKKQLLEDAKDREIPLPRICNDQIRQLEMKAKRMSLNYSKLVYMYTSIGSQDEDPLAHCNSKL